MEKKSEGREEVKGKANRGRERGAISFDLLWAKREGIESGGGTECESRDSDVK